MYKIGELSKLSQIPVKTLRFYDTEGILPPDVIDEFTGYRYYGAAKLSDCYRIIALKELGFCLSEIKEFFSLPKEKFSELIEAKEGIWRWVNGYVVCNPRSTASSYVIQKKEGIEYLLVQRKVSEAFLYNGRKG